MRLVNMVDILPTTFSNAFTWTKIFVFWLKFHERLFQRVIGSGNDLVPNTWNAITWTIVDQDLWCYMTPLGHIELNLYLADIVENI